MKELSNQSTTCTCGSPISLERREAGYEICTSCSDARTTKKVLNTYEDKDGNIQTSLALGVTPTHAQHTLFDSEEEVLKRQARGEL